MNPDIYILLNDNGNLYKPATQATALAKYSRSAKSARDTASELSDEEADKFNSKWVIDYGHSSVAELATIPVCFEGVSMIATKYLESYPRGAYSEKSTRYQEFKPDFIWPCKSNENLRSYIDRLFSDYKELYDDLIPVACETFNIDPTVEKNRKLAFIKAWAFDIVRNILPCGTKTSLAGVYNLRDLRYMIQDLMNHSNPELRTISGKVLSAAKEIVPTLVRDPRPNHFKSGVKGTGYIPSDVVNFSPSLRVEFNERHSTDRRYAWDLFEEELQNVYGSDLHTFEKLMESRGASAVPDVFQIVRIAFDVIMDFGSFRDLARHRRSQIIYETPNLDYGFVIPDEIRGTPLGGRFKSIMESIESVDFGQESIPAELYSYFVPMGYLHSSRFIMDFKQLYYMTELRTRPSGHVSYREVCYKMYEEASKRYPEIMQWCKVTHPSVRGVHH